MTAGGVFLHNCEAGNNIGTRMSRNISVFVNSKYGAFWPLKKKNLETDESTRPRAFICFSVFGTRDKARSPSF